MTLNTYPPNPNAGREVADVTMGTNTGPTGVANAPAADVLADFGVVLVRAVPHFFEISLAIGSSVATALQFEMWEGPPGAPVTRLGVVPAWLDGVRPATLSGRVRFVPLAGSRNYHVRWSNLGGGGVTYTIWSGNYAANLRLVEVA